MLHDEGRPGISVVHITSWNEGLASKHESCFDKPMDPIPFQLGSAPGIPRQTWKFQPSSHQAMEMWDSVIAYSCILIFKCLMAVSVWDRVFGVVDLPEIWPMLQLWKHKLLQNWCASWHVLVGKTLLKCSLTERIQMFLYKFCEHCLAWRFHAVFICFHDQLDMFHFSFEQVFVMFSCCFGVQVPDLSG